MTPATIKAAVSAAVNTLILAGAFWLDQFAQALVPILPAEAWYTALVFVALKFVQQAIARQTSTGGEQPVSKAVE